MWLKIIFYVSLSFSNSIYYQYDSFDDYRHNYVIFEDIKGKVGDDYSSFPKEIIKDKIENDTSIIFECLRLKKYLMNFSNEKECQKRNCCAYANYMLNKGILNYYKSPTYIFNIYNSYMNHPSNDKIKDLCLSKIIYMDKEKHEKIDNLYSAYKTCHLFFSNERNTTCSLAKSCATAYNNIIYQHPNPDDDKFCKAVNDFKKILEKNEHISGGKCGAQIPYLFSYPDTLTLVHEDPEQNSIISEDHGRSILTEKAYKGSSIAEEQQETAAIRENHITSSISLGSALPVTLFSSGISALLILLSLYKVNNNIT